MFLRLQMSQAKIVGFVLPRQRKDLYSCISVSGGLGEEAVGISSFWSCLGEEAVGFVTGNDLYISVSGLGLGRGHRIFWTYLGEEAIGYLSLPDRGMTYIFPFPDQDQVSVLDKDQDHTVMRS